MFKTRSGNKKSANAGQEDHLHEDRLAATGTEIHGQGTVHGQTLTKEHQSVFQITDVADPNFVPYSGNLSEAGMQLYRSLCHLRH